MVVVTVAADETYRSEIVFDVNDKDAIRRINEAEERIKKSFTEISKRGKALGREKFDPILDYRDRLTPRIKEAERMIKALSNTTAAPLITQRGNLQKDLEIMKKTLDEINRAHPEVTITFRDRVSAKVEGVKKAVAALAGHTYTVTIMALDKTRGVLGGIKDAATGPMAMGLGAGVAYGGVYKPLELSGKKEQNLLSMSFFNGGDEAGQKAYDKIVNFAAKTPYSMNFSLEQATGLMGSYKGMDMKPDDMMSNSMRTLTAFGDAAGLTGAGESGAKQALYGFRQIGTIGKLQLEELRQVTENLMVPMEFVRKELGLTQEEMSKVGDKGIPAKKAMEAIVVALEKNFGGGMDKLSGTLLGLGSTLKDTGQIGLTALGDGMAVPVKRIFQDLAGTTDYTSDRFKAFAAKLGDIGKGIGNIFEGVYLDAKNYFTNKILNNPEFQKLDMEGKIRFVVDDVRQVFEEWMNSEGTATAAQFGADLGVAFIKAFGKSMLEGIMNDPALALVIGVGIGLTSPTPIGIVVALSVIAAPWVKKLFEYISPSVQGEKRMDGIVDLSNKMDEFSKDPNNTGKSYLGETTLSGKPDQPWYKDTWDWAGNAAKTLQRSVRGYANGGFINRAHVGMIGEAGPEVVIPLSSGRRDRAMALYEATGSILKGSGEGYAAPTASGATGGNTIVLKMEGMVGDIIIQGSGDIAAAVQQVSDMFASRLKETLTNIAEG